ncbi:MAG: UvrD-helicase domain-containing protein [Treponema sp.]|jgi:DNA helicase-2/ATP-dependent DNA helicase PcrA|nr:UvrD-helicase domain-containing protein [Treponema sp.]
MPKLNLQAELNPPQLQAVTHVHGPLLIIAGAGSGKTRVITYRIAHMLERGIPQSAILALTFTNKAAREMETRVKELTARKLQSLTVSTFHAFGVKILREEIERLGFRKNFSIYDETDRNQLLKDSMRERGHSLEGTDLYALGQLFSNVKTKRVRWGEGADLSLEDVYTEYQNSLKVFNAVDFDDLLALPISIFEQFPDALEKYRARYRYILVDEFQDTSLIQYRLMRLLADKNVCVVGDDDQSIYSWRGANYENLLQFERDFPETVEIKLEQNYRSTTTILEAANGVIANNTNRKEKALWSGKAGGKPIALYYPSTESDEAGFIASEIKKMRFNEHRKYDDFGVLIRTNSLTRAIEEAFLAEDIPYRVSGGSSFFQRKEIKDALSYLRVIANPDDDVNLLRIINTPRRGIGKSSITQLTGLARKNNSSIWDALNRLRYAQDTLFTETNRADLDDFASLIERYREKILGKRGLSAQVHAMVDEIDYWSYLVSEHSKEEKVARWKFANLNTLVQSIATWEHDPDNLDPTLFAYLNRVSLITQNESDDPQDKGKVTISTIHAAKGLEYPVVFIAGAEDGIIPHARSLEEGDSDSGVLPIEEERRLFYVAITRARDKLIITSCLHRRRLQSETDCSPSPFLAEIPSHLIEENASEETEEDDAQAAAKFFAQLKSRFR